MLTKDEVGEMMEMLSGKQFASHELDQVDCDDIRVDRSVLTCR